MTHKLLLLVLLLLVLLVLHLNLVEAEKKYDFYKVLGVGRNADEAEIKRAYRKQAMRYHPDKHPEEKKAKAEEKFMMVSKAYETLSDPQKRAIYDEQGEEGLNRAAGGGGGGPGGFPGGFQFTSNGGGGQAFDPFEMFQKMFGFGGVPGGGGFPGGFGGQQRGQQQRGQQQQQEQQSGFFRNDPHVVEITSMGLAKSTIGKTARGEQVWAVLFYSPQCGHCNAMKGEWSKFAKGAGGVVKVAAVNCLSLNELCASYKVKAFPTIIILSREKAEEFKGQRVAKAFNDAAVRKIPTNYVTFFQNEKQIEELAASKSDQLFIVLLTNKPTSSSMFNALSTEFKSHKAITFAAVKIPESKSKNPFDYLGAKITHVPTLLGLYKEGKSISTHQYDGDLKFEELKKFIREIEKNMKIRLKKLKNEKKEKKEDL